MTDYQQGKIYRLINAELPDLVYIGSTTLKLNIRFNNHLCDVKRQNCSSFLLFSIGKPTIELIENYPCNSNLELVKREGHHQLLNNCVNKQIAGRTDKERREDNKENKKMYDKEYREDNKEKIKDYSKQWRTDNKKKQNEKFDCGCGGIYQRQHKSQHIKTKKHIKFIENKI